MCNLTIYTFLHARLARVKQKSVDTAECVSSEEFFVSFSGNEMSNQKIFNLLTENSRDSPHENC